MSIHTQAQAVDTALTSLVDAIATLRASVQAEASAQGGGTSTYSAATNRLGDIEGFEEALADAIVGRCGLGARAIHAAKKTALNPGATAVADRLARYS